MKPITIDYANSTIILSSAFQKRAFTPGTIEYKQLQDVRRDFEGFKLATRQFDKNTKQERYKGLTYDFMRWYIQKVEGENAPAILNVFEDMIDISKCHSVSKRYPVIKSQFLAAYPEIAEFGMVENELLKFRESVNKANSEKVIELGENITSEELDMVS